MKLSIFIFTRDLRLYDNTSLLEALKNSDFVIPIFIFNPNQITDKNKYKSNNCIQFMCECLDELDEELRKYKSKLYFFNDYHEKVIEYLIKHNNDIDSVYINMDYTQFAKTRDEKIKKVCDKYKINFYSFEDYLLTSKDKIVNSSGNCYVKFTPFYEKAKNEEVQRPKTSKLKNYINSKFKFKNEYTKDYHNFYEENNNISVRGGRNNALQILKNIKEFDSYNEDRDYPSKNKTTKLSAYLKFNVVSIREVYDIFTKKLKKTNKLITQLYWREFYMILLYHYPDNLGNSMREKYDKIKWDNNKKLFKLWCEGKTGFPIIDAGMRELNTTGFMHNRCRMITSSFLIKILQIDWRWGEKYFAQNLVDYDPANNNGGWQWGAGSGSDSQPYFRIFNPMRQIDKFDKDCEYIKKWVPELVDLSSKEIKKWDEIYKEHKNIKYSDPIVDYAERKQKTLTMYEKIY
jgi:deoxyribodipyrimidine photo-lyase